MFWIDTHLGLMAMTILAGLAVLMLTQQRRTPQSGLAWLLFFVVWPWVAVPLFLLLGFRKDRTFARLDLPPDPATISGDAPRIARDFAALGAPPALPGNRVDLIPDPQNAARAIDQMIDTAHETLDVCTYLIQPDEIGAAFVDRLTGRVRDGVRVRLLVDRIGGWRKPAAALRAFRSAGGELHMFPPFRTGLLRSHLNLRLHRKSMIADGTCVLTGGRNIGRDYLGPAGDPATWRDLTVALGGPVADAYVRMFASDWGAAVPPPAMRPATGPSLAQLVPSGPDRREDSLHDGLVQAIHVATSRVWIVTPYFVPTEALVAALSIAARRGVDVRIILPERSNHRIADVARGPCLKRLADDGACVTCLGGTMIHAKAGVIDDAAWVGSANFDVRSMLLNFEAALFLHDPASVTPVSDWIASLAAEGRLFRPADGAHRRAAEALFALWTPIL